MAPPQSSSGLHLVGLARRRRLWAMIRLFQTALLLLLTLGQALLFCLLYSRHLALAQDREGQVDTTHLGSDLLDCTMHMILTFKLPDIHHSVEVLQAPNTVFSLAHILLFFCPIKTLLF